MAIDKLAKCCPDKWHYSKGLCYVCYLKEYTEKLKNKRTNYWEKRQKLNNFEKIIASNDYESQPPENIPDLKRDDYWIQQGDARKLPRLITI